MKKMMMKLWKDEEGATMVEYGIMVALIAVIVMAAVGPLGTSIGYKHVLGKLRFLRTADNPTNMQDFVLPGMYSGVHQLPRPSDEEDPQQDHPPRDRHRSRWNVNFAGIHGVLFFSRFSAGGFASAASVYAERNGRGGCQSDWPRWGP